jgi:hypothetical protein
MEGPKGSSKAPFAILFLEGKVLAKGFQTKPSLINWQFHRSKK